MGQLGSTFRRSVLAVSIDFGVDRTSLQSPDNPGIPMPGIALTMRAGEDTKMDCDSSLVSV